MGCMFLLTMVMVPLGGTVEGWLNGTFGLGWGSLLVGFLMDFLMTGIGMFGSELCVGARGG